MSRLILLVWAACAAYGAEQWTKLRTANFEMYTTAGERTGRDAILHFEQVRGFFARVMQFKPDSVERVRIVAFRNENEYKPYRPNEVAFAYYVPGHDRDYIVMQRAASEYYPVVIHEYVHLLIRHSTDGDKIPLWLNEGLAELYASLKPIGKQVQVGDFHPGRVQVLRDQKWLPLETLLTVDHKSAHYNEKNRAGVFYAQSWLLTHMLFLADDYRPKFAELLRELIRGSEPASAFQKIYGRGLDQIRKDLDAYVRSSTIKVALFDVKLEKSAEAPEVQAASGLDSGLALAGVLGAIRKADEARQTYERLDRENPGRPELHEAMGYLAWRNRDPERAVTHFERAASASRSAKFFLDYAQAARAARKPDTEIIPLLEKALEINPADFETRWLAGALNSNARKYPEARAHFRKITRVTPDRAYDYFRLLAFASYQCEDREEARKAAERASGYAKSAEDKKWIDDFLGYLDRPTVAASAAPAASALAASGAEDEDRVRIQRRGLSTSATWDLPKPPDYLTFEGAFTHLDCLEGKARMMVAKNGRTAAFAILDPNAIVIRSATNGQVELSCGAQKNQSVVIEYQPKDDAALKTVGVVKTVEFREAR